MESQSKTFQDFLPKDPAKLKDRMSEWLEFAGMGQKYNCISLGQGTP